MEKYYNLKKIDKKNALYNIIIGKRSNGKTYSVLEKCLKNYFSTGERFAYVRRYDENIKPKNLNQLFRPHNIERLSKGEYNTVKYISRCFYFAYYDSEKECFTKTADEFFCKTYALNTWESVKGADAGFFKFIIFDEFLTRDIYLYNEFVIFSNILSSIIRDRNGTTIYMLGNTVNKYCPYFKEMGLNNVENMCQGDIDVYTYGTSDLTVAVEYCADTENTKKINKYFAFDNPKLNMITTGVWEIDNYPHCTISFDKNDIKMIFYIEFSRSVICCKIINKGDKLFIFCHASKPLQYKDDTIVYSEEFDERPTHLININHKPFKVCNLIYTLFHTNKVCYADNSVGEIIRNWLKNS